MSEEKHFRNYINKDENNFDVWRRNLLRIPRMSKKYVSFLEAGLTKFVEDKTLKDNERYIDLWIDLSLKVPKKKALKIFDFLFKKSIGKKSAKFYLIWSTHLAKAKDKKAAIKVLSCGIKNKAHPTERLEQNYKKLVKTTEKTYVRAYLPVYEEENVSFEEKRAECPVYLSYQEPSPEPQKTAEKKRSDNNDDIINDSFKSSEDDSFESNFLPGDNKVVNEEADQNVIDDIFNDSKKESLENFLEGSAGQESLDMKDELVLEMLNDKSDTLADPTKTFSAKTFLKTPLPTRLFSSKKLQKSVRKESETFIDTRNEFLMSNKRSFCLDKRKFSGSTETEKITKTSKTSKMSEIPKTPKMAKTNQNNSKSPFDYTARKRFVLKLESGKTKIATNHVEFDFLHKNKFNENEFQYVTRLQKGLGLHFKVVGVEKRISSELYFVVLANRVEQGKIKIFSFRISKKPWRLKYEVYLYYLLVKHLGSQDSQYFIIAKEVEAYRKEVFSSVCLNPSGAISLHKFRATNSEDQTLTIFLAYQMIKAIRRLHSADIIHADLSLKMFYLGDVKKILKKQRNKHWWRATNLYLRISDFSFHKSFFPDLKYRVTKHDGLFLQKNALFNRQPMAFRNRSDWLHDIDGIGLCSAINQLLNGNELEIELWNGRHFRPTNRFKTEVNSDLWVEVYFSLLNLGAVKNGVDCALRKLEAKLFKTKNLEEMIFKGLRRASN